MRDSCMKNVLFEQFFVNELHCSVVNELNEVYTGSKCLFMRLDRYGKARLGDCIINKY